MKTHRILSIILATAALLGLGGCATSVTAKKIQSRFQSGEQSLYVVVPTKPRILSQESDFKGFCLDDPSAEIFNASARDWMKKNVCTDIGGWQIVPGVYQTKVWGSDGLRLMGSLAPANWSIDSDDILEISLDISVDGKFMRPNLVKRIARKAKDATKESGCYWDGGKGATTAFIGGGAVCDGWNWRDQKFAKE
jgi:hypothetical protein